MRFARLLTTALLVATSSVALGQPATCETAILTASNAAAGQGFGYCDVSGDVIAVGGEGHDQVYMFRRSGPAWLEEQILTASSSPGSSFSQLSIDGDTIAIAATFDDQGAIDAGAVYLFEYQGTSWVETQKLIASDAEANANFGYSVALNGDLLIVGAWQDDSNAVDAGAAYIFRRSAGVWTEEQKLTPTDGGVQDWFGFDVAITADAAVVGSLQHDLPHTDCGAAYTYRFDGVVWTFEQKLSAGFLQPGDHFGQSVVLEGDRLAVSAPRDDTIATDTGSVCCFEYSAGIGWAESQHLIPIGLGHNDTLGRRLALDGDRLLMSSIWDDDLGTNSGAAYLYMHDGSGWVQGPKLTSSNGSGGDTFAGMVALDDSYAAIGAPYTGQLGFHTGSVYTYVVDGEDCDGNGHFDLCEIATGAAADSNGDDIPDHCIGIDAHPQSQGACVGDTVTFEIVAVGTPLTYQWYQDGVVLPGETASVLTIQNVQPSDAGFYDVVVSGPAGATSISNAAELTVGVPTITLQPLPPTGICVGDSLELTVTATGAAPLQYQWRRNGMPIAGATSPSLLVPLFRVLDQGDYDVVVSNSCGFQTSLPILLPACPFVRGDANGDGNVNISDVVFTLWHLFNGGPGPCHAAMDTTDDETVNLGDAVFLLATLFSGGPAPEAPWEQCGVDPTPGGIRCGTYGACP